MDDSTFKHLGKDALTAAEQKALQACPELPNVLRLLMAYPKDYTRYSPVVDTALSRDEQYVAVEGTVM